MHSKRYSIPDAVPMRVFTYTVLRQGQTGRGARCPNRIGRTPSRIRGTSTPVTEM